MIHDFNGEEIIEGTTQKLNGTYLTEITGMWYYPGMPEDVQKPEIRITATYSFTSDHLPDNAPSFPNRSQDGLTEEEFLSAWNNLLSLSIRINSKNPLRLRIPRTHEKPIKTHKILRIFGNINYYS